MFRKVLHNMLETLYFADDSLSLVPGTEITMCFAVVVNAFHAEQYYLSVLCHVLHHVSDLQLGGLPVQCVTCDGLVSIAQCRMWLVSII